MKKHTLCKILSIILCAALLLVPLLSVGASAANKKEYPLVNVPGFMSSDIFSNPDDPCSDTVWPVSQQGILNIVGSCIPALTEFLVTKNWDKLGNSIASTVFNALKVVCSDEDGEVRNTTGARVLFKTVEDVRKARKNDEPILFEYDWRRDPLKTAEELDNFIDLVREATGSDKVSINCHSLGGVIFLTYITLFGNDKIDSVVLNSTAINGVTYIGEMLNGNLVITKDSLHSFLNYAFDSTQAEALLTSISDMLYSAGIYDRIEALADDILAHLTEKALSDVFVPLFCRWPTVWAMSPDEKIEKNMDLVFGKYMEDNEQTRVLKEKIVNFNEKIRPFRQQTLLKLDEDCNIGVFSRYGYSSMPVTSQWKNNSDGIIDAKNTSFGATVAPYGETLPQEMLDATAPEYISPDKNINASTCMFPEKTWFFKGVKHSQECPDLHALADLIITSEEEFTVDSDPRFPRFLCYSYAEDALVKDSAGQTNDGINRVVLFFKNLFARINEIFSKLKKLFSSFATS